MSDYDVITTAGLLTKPPNVTASSGKPESMQVCVSAMTSVSSIELLAPKNSWSGNSVLNKHLVLMFIVKLKGKSPICHRAQFLLCANSHTVVMNRIYVLVKSEGSDCCGAESIMPLGLYRPLYTVCVILERWLSCKRWREISVSARRRIYITQRVQRL